MLNQMIFAAALLAAALPLAAQTPAEWPLNPAGPVPAWVLNRSNPYEQTGQIAVAALEHVRQQPAGGRGLSADRQALLEAYLAARQVPDGSREGAALKTRIEQAAPADYEDLLRQEGYSERAIAYYRQLNTAGTGTSLRAVAGAVRTLESQVLADQTLANGEQMMLLATASTVRYLSYYSGMLSAAGGQVYHTTTTGGPSLPDTNGDGVIDAQDAVGNPPPSPSYGRLLTAYGTILKAGGHQVPVLTANDLDDPSSNFGPPFLPVLPACGTNCGSK